ncbi:hypothetical protein CFIO01_12812 [Colletotrichum fioriniae PJ7]|uniref:DUF3295 domain-containing protein n=1 Tax=Colletotrichum fioriniae PJ7 TaxID=1445577 RepID=A0A010PZT1_9PEZI|nr:hypothetical protein CFIO01_12812 [Colletotrichum fioriniae PJ7]
MPNSAGLDPEREAQDDGQTPSQPSAERDKIQPDDPDSDYGDEYAIDVDDIADMSSEEPFFQRIKPKLGLNSHCSLITLLFKQKTRDRGMGHVVPLSTSDLPCTLPSQPAPPTLAVSSKDSDDAPLMMGRGNGSVPLKSITEAPLCSAGPVNATIDNDSATLSSPQTTRRNMIAT